jgi:transposase-like protein
MEDNMDTINKLQSGKYQPRKVRVFSKEFKKDIAEKIEMKKISINEVKKLYSVSDTSVRRWIYNNSKNTIQGCRMVVEKDSEGYQIQKILDRNAELERMVGKKQIEIEFLNKVIDLCSDKLGYDVKKKITTSQ